MSENRLARLAVPGVVLLIAFLSYSSQLLFRGLDPGPLSNSQSVRFNVLVGCIWVCYARTCLASPGSVPGDWEGKPERDAPLIPAEQRTRSRFCRKCEALKPPRSHHCKVCKRCIPKMDHHCPWTANCVSHFTFPHFIRFLFYAVTSMAYLEYFLYVRGAVIWDNRKLPSYLGPSVSQLVHLFLLMTVNSLTLFLVGISFLRALYALGANVTTIESWEIERHEQLLRRARVLGGYLDGPDGIRVKIVRHEFPYDIGIWQNIRDGMGTANILAWLWPFARTVTTGGVSFETNGFEDPGTSWPPPDPDRMPRAPRSLGSKGAFTYRRDELTANEEIEAFKKRQKADIERRRVQTNILRRKPFYTRYESENGIATENDYFEGDAESLSGEEGWQDSGGNRLKDYGVEEDVEFYDEDDIPIGELLRRREERKHDI